MHDEESIEIRGAILQAIIEDMLREGGIYEMGDITAEWRDRDADVHVIQAVSPEGHSYAVTVRIESEEPR